MTPLPFTPLLSLQTILSTIIYLTSLLTTIQTSSRLHYMLQHSKDGQQTIGFMDGPLILPPSTTGEAASPLWEASFAFQRAAHLGLLYGEGENGGWWEEEEEEEGEEEMRMYGYTIGEKLHSKTTTTSPLLLLLEKEKQYQDLHFTKIGGVVGKKKKNNCILYQRRQSLAIPATAAAAVPVKKFQTSNENKYSTSFMAMVPYSLSPYAYTSSSTKNIENKNEQKKEEEEEEGIVYITTTTTSPSSATAATNSTLFTTTAQPIITTLFSYTSLAFSKTWNSLVNSSRWCRILLGGLPSNSKRRKWRKNRRARRQKKRLAAQLEEKKEEGAKNNLIVVEETNGHSKNVTLIDRNGGGGGGENDILAIIHEKQKRRYEIQQRKMLIRDWRKRRNGEEGLDFTTTVNQFIHIPSTTNKRARITAYAPKTFASLRNKHFGISEHEYRNSILNLGPYVSFQSNSKGAARVGGFFFFTRDGAYMIKTIKKGEVKTFLSMLPKYYRHMKRNSRRSLLTRFCGMYSIQIDDSSGKQSGKRGGKAISGKEHVFVVMNSVFPAEGSKFISERYDLKGSTVGRECSEEEKRKKGSNAVLKDNDLAREVNSMRSSQSSAGFPTYGINIGARGKAALLTQLRRDVSFLQDCKVMDYSLLVGVVNLESKEIVPFKFAGDNSKKLSKRSGHGRIISSLATPLGHLSAPPIYLGRRLFSALENALSTVYTSPLPYYGAGDCGVDGGALSIVRGRRLGHRAIYYMGVIDFLQPWTLAKVLERDIKGLLGYDTKAISCVAPKDYAARFLDFIDSHVT